MLCPIICLLYSVLWNIVFFSFFFFFFFFILLSVLLWLPLLYRLRFLCVIVLTPTNQWRLRLLFCWHRPINNDYDYPAVGILRYVRSLEILTKASFTEHFPVLRRIYPYFIFWDTALNLHLSPRRIYRELYSKENYTINPYSPLLIFSDHRKWSNIKLYTVGYSRNGVVHTKLEWMLFNATAVFQLYHGKNKKYLMRW